MQITRDQLRKIIIEANNYFRDQLNSSIEAKKYIEQNDEDNAGLKLLQKAYPQWYIDEVNEDIENFKNILLLNDVKVLRPEWPFESSQFSSPQWTTNGYDIYNVRDNQIIFGNNIVSTPPSSRYRQNE